jgi:hypothetical protein
MPGKRKTRTVGTIGPKEHMIGVNKVLQFWKYTGRVLEVRQAKYGW